MHFLPPRGGWNPLGGRLGGSKAIAGRLNLRLGSNHVAARAAAGEAAAGQAANEGQLSLQRFPLKAALTAGGLAVAGDTIAQFVERVRRRRAVAEATKDASPCCRQKKLADAAIWDHDYVRALRMASYGFLFYGPFSHVWYRFLDQQLPAKTLSNFAIKVAANQVVLGPTVITVVFAYNFAWMGKLADLPAKYRNDMFPTLLDGWKFWIPVALLNFGVVPLPARVAFMSSASVFWNFYLSMSIGRSQQEKSIATT